MHGTLAIGSVLFALLLLGLAGCSGKKFSVDKFGEIKRGVTEEKVLELLGKPTETAEGNGVKGMWWKSGDEYYGVKIKDGKVVEYSAAMDEKAYEANKRTVKGSQ
jgi:hypothetical protein